MKDKVIDFSKASEEYRKDREHRDKEEKVEAMKARFTNALPDKPRPVRDYLRKKRAKKKR